MADGEWESFVASLETDVFSLRDENEESDFTDDGSVTVGDLGAADAATETNPFPFASGETRQPVIDTLIGAEERGPNEAAAITQAQPIERQRFHQCH
jgi:hypothetical protein